MSEYPIPVGVCRFCAGPEHASGTMCSMHPDLITERMAPYAFTGDTEDYVRRIKGLEADVARLTAENRQLREALEAMVEHANESSYDNRRKAYEQARAALQAQKEGA